ncbi:MAG: ABC transporter ATP-binding protein [Clostridia bacterium]|nr:ABC transporter ATP-binding protein [Clostridia bacterium]
MADRIIELKNIRKSFDGETVLDGIDLYIRRREFLTLLGPSGCGKTTMLRIIAGFETADSGDLLFEGQRINDVPPYKRRVNTVFQRYSLFPHMNVFDNVAFGLNIKKMGKAEIARRVAAMLEMVGLAGYEKRQPESLSGGQQQRVAIARALVNEPEVLLLDEPLAALDLKMRKEMQLELKRMQQQLGITFIFVTHDQEEALTMSDTIVVMSRGQIQQIGTPVDIYNEPANAFVADFIGESNLLEGVMEKDYLCRFAGYSFPCLDKGFMKNEEVEIVVRPEDVDIVAPEKGMIVCTVRSIVFMGVHYEIMLEGADGMLWKVHTTDPVEPGAVVGLYLDPDAIHVMKSSDEPLASEQEEMAALEEEEDEG